MENTIIAPTYEVTVEFKWKYPGKPIMNKKKTGLVQTNKTDDKLIAEVFINSFITNYEVGICEVTDMNIVSIEQVYTFDEWVEKYNPIKNEFEDSSFSPISRDPKRLGYDHEPCQPRLHQRQPSPRAQRVHRYQDQHQLLHQPVIFLRHL